jgi:restriction system protein
MANNGGARRERPMAQRAWPLSGAAAAMAAAGAVGAWIAPWGEWVPPMLAPMAKIGVAAALACVALAMGSAALSGHARWAKRKGLADKRWTLEKLAAMDWRDFETLTAVAFERQGWAVEQTGLGGADGGVDVALRKNGEKAIAQCKRHANAVGVKVARELLGEMHARRAQRAFLVSAAGFTREAVAFEASCKQSGNPLTLVDGQALLRMLGGKLPEGAIRREGAPSAAAPAGQSPVTGSTARAARIQGQIPQCPRCGGEMRPARAKKGATAGQWFWGCSRWPQCNGTRPDDGRLLAWASKRQAQSGR